MNKGDILPQLRNDLSFREYTENGEKFIILVDAKGYAKQPVSLPVSILTLFNLINGTKTTEQFIHDVKQIIGEEADFVIEHFLNLIEFLDFYGYLESSNFLEIKRDIDTYHASPVRVAVCTDNSYPSDSNELTAYLDKLFATASIDSTPGNAISIVVPHIDFRIGDAAHKCYAAGYHSIRQTETDLFVILGTSHQGNSDYFMLTRKDFETPVGIVETDKEIIDVLTSKLPFELTIDDMAHRHEHSIEFQVVLLQHYFKNRNFKILPVLVGSFHNFIYENTTPESDIRFKEFIQKLNDTLTEKGRKAVFIASADMAHIGRKFNDDFDAESMLTILRADDSALLEYMESCQADKFFGMVSEVKDKNKICGLSPVYSLLKLTSPSRGKLLDYSIWNETETKSAVSFASMAFYD